MDNKAVQDRHIIQLDNRLPEYQKENELQSLLWGLTTTSVNLHVKICRKYEQHVTMGSLKGEKNGKRGC